MTRGRFAAETASFTFICYPRGMPSLIAKYLRDFIIEHFDEAQDRHIAESRLADRRLPISGLEMRRDLGLPLNPIAAE